MIVTIVITLKKTITLITIITIKICERFHKWSLQQLELFFAENYFQDVYCTLVLLLNTSRETSPNIFFFLVKWYMFALWNCCKL